MKSLMKSLAVHPRLKIAGEVPLQFGPNGYMKSPWLLDDFPFDPQQEGL